MQNIQTLIFNLLNDDKKTLVFTSEIVARSWLRKYAVESGKKTIFTERAISWDKFKSTFVNPGSLKQISGIERQIFASIFMQENYKKLTYFSSNYKESMSPFATAVASYLPFFAYANEKSEETVHDIDLIMSAYRKFLFEKGLYEYNLLERDYSHINKDFVLFFPETFNDPIVEEIKNLCTVISTKQIDNKSNEIISYKNSITEIRTVMRDIAKRLDEGEDPNNISITCACTDNYRPYLETEAKKLDIELCFTTSVPICSSPQGRFFERIHRIVEEDYSFDSVKAFLLDPGFPFKDPDKCISLLRIAIKKLLKKETAKEWMHRLEQTDSYDFFCKIHEGLNRIFNAENTDIMAETIDEFSRDFLNVNACFFSRNGVYEKYLQLLRLCGDYRLFLQILQNETYVDSARNGIRVYRYPVSAAISSNVSYVIGLDDKNTAVSFDKYPYLPMFRKDLDELEATVKTDDILSVYCNNDSPSKVFLSGTKEGFDGTRLLPMKLVEKSPEELNDIYKTEEELWRDPKRIDKFSKNQRKGYEEASKGLLDYNNSYSFPDSEKLQNLDISASSFKEFVKCPFKGYVSIYLQPEQLDLEPRYLNPLFVGNILHHTIQKALKEVQIFANLNEEVLIRKLNSEVQKAVENYELGSGVYKDYLITKYSILLPEIVKCASDDCMNGATLYGNEINFDLKHKVNGLNNVYLKGRIDTVLMNFDGFVVIDYKTSDYTKDYSSELRDCNPQLALYSKLIRENIKDSEVTAGAYYVISKGEMKYVWPDKKENSTVGITDVDFDFNEKEEALKKAILSSDFKMNNDDDVCANCAYSSICRRRFTVK